MSAKEYPFNWLVLANLICKAVCSKQDCEDTEINLGDLVVSVRSASGRRKLYHRKCAEILNII